jgi:hypothetical protein
MFVGATGKPGLAGETARSAARPPKRREFSQMADSPNRYTCHEYREEMLLLSLRRRFTDDSLTAAEKEALQKEIAELEEQMGMK